MPYIKDRSRRTSDYELYYVRLNKWIAGIFRSLDKTSECVILMATRLEFCGKSHLQMLLHRIDNGRAWGQRQVARGAPQHQRWKSKLSLIGSLAPGNRRTDGRTAYRPTFVSEIAPIKAD